MLRIYDSGLGACASGCCPDVGATDCIRVCLACRNAQVLLGFAAEGFGLRCKS